MKTKLVAIETPFVAACLVLASACSAEPGVDVATEEENVDTTELGAWSCGAMTFSHYSTNGLPTHEVRDMGSISEKFCFLSRIGGDLNWYHTSNGASVLVSNGRWILDRRGAMHGSATCVPLSCFRADGQNDVVWISDNSSTKAVADRGCFGDCSARQTSRSLWWGDATTVLQAFGTTGLVEGCGERAWVQLSTWPSKPSTLNARDAQCDCGGLLCKCDSTAGVWTGANSFFVGTPGGIDFAMYDGPYDTDRGISFTGMYTADSSGTATQWMAAAHESMCFFTSLCGQFNGGGEFAQIVPESDAAGVKRWRLKTQHLSGSGVRASAACFRYYQRAL